MGKIKKALITGITGQDGSYLAEYLLSLNWEVCKDGSTILSDRFYVICKFLFSLIVWINVGITEPDEPNTFPKRVITNSVLLNLSFLF